MRNKQTLTGSQQEFDSVWKQKKEQVANHWRNGNPRNQTELAFAMHWKLFSQFIKTEKHQLCLEVGCGRGSISSFFAQEGFRCLLVDTSLDALQIARRIFIKNNHNAFFVCGNVSQLPFKDASMGIIVSIGLLEHFKCVKPPIEEQARIISKSGRILAYVIPKRPVFIQNMCRPINWFLKVIYRVVLEMKKPLVVKVPLFRNLYRSGHYKKVFEQVGFHNNVAMGVYPLPMISYSTEFPFSYMPPVLERMLTMIFACILYIRKIVFRRNPWICQEGFGQAILVTATK
ncbi:class I SAM-dependent methyltransferase [Chlamydiota bacterium]